MLAGASVGFARGRSDVGRGPAPTGLYQSAAMYWVSQNSYSGHLTDVPLGTTEYHNAPKPQVNRNDCPQTVNGCCDHGDPWGTISYWF